MLPLTMGITCYRKQNGFRVTVHLPFSGIELAPSRVHRGSLHSALIFNTRRHLSTWSMGLHLLLRRRDRETRKLLTYWNSSQLNLPRPWARMWNGYLYQGRVEMGILARTILGQQIHKDSGRLNKYLTFGPCMVPSIISVINVLYVGVCLITITHEGSQAQKSLHSVNNLNYFRRRKLAEMLNGSLRIMITLDQVKVPYFQY